MAIIDDKYKKLLKSLLPIGWAWPKEKATNMDSFLGSMSVELGRVDTRVEDMLREAYPLTSSELLVDWERICGLPSECYGLGETVQIRREDVHRKLSSLGAQNPQYYIDLAANVGFDVTITEYSPFLVGQDAAGDPVNDEDWAYAWQVNAPEDTIKYFRAGEGAAGEPLASWGNELLECVISEVKPAHTILLFAYGS